MIIVLLILANVLITGVTLFSLRNYRAGSPMFWFPVILCLMAVGTFLIMDISQTADRTYTAMMFLALLVFSVSSMMATNVMGLAKSYAAHCAKPMTPASPEQKLVAVLIFTLSVAITILYYRAVGYNVFALMLTGDLTEDYSDLRLNAYGEGDYFAPGYVNQFKNVLLPITAVSCALWLRASRHKGLFYAFSAGAAVIIIFALLGTGQRGYLIYTALSLVFGFFLLNIGQPSRIKASYLAAAGFPVLLLFGFMTGAYTGAADEGGGAILSKMVDRFTSIQQESGLFGFRYIFPFPTAWFTEWWQNVVGILPSSEGSTLAHEVHEVYYGSFRGTAPLSSTGSAYYNGGVFGVVLLFAIMGWSYTYLYKRYLDGPRTELRAIAYGFIFFYLSMYVSDAPTILIDNGVLAAMILLLITKIRAMGRASPAPTLGAARGF